MTQPADAGFIDLVSASICTAFWMANLVALLLQFIAQPRFHSLSHLCMYIQAYFQERVSILVFLLVGFALVLEQPSVDSAVRVQAVIH